MKCGMRAVALIFGAAGVFLVAGAARAQVVACSNLDECVYRANCARTSRAESMNALRTRSELISRPV